MFILFLLFVIWGCNNQNDNIRIYDDEWVALDTIGIVYLTVWPDVEHRTDEQIEIVDYKSIGVAWLVNKQLKDNPYFPRIELDENGVNGEAIIWPVFEGYNLKGLSISLPERLFTYNSVIKLYEYAVSIYDSLANVEPADIKGDILLERAGIE